MDKKRKQTFKPMAYNNISLYTTVYIEISNDGGCARWMESTYYPGQGATERRHGSWQEIKYAYRRGYSKEFTSPYIRQDGKRLWIDGFIKI